MKKLLLLLIVALGALAQASAQEVKNVILMIGDGMGLGAVSATMVAGNYAPMALDRAQYIGLARTYSANNRVTDSAASGTALATGHKTYNGAIGVDVDTLPVESILEQAGNQGFATGVVVTCYLPHATPAAFVAHQPSRYADLEAIAADFLEAPLDVMIGGGSNYFSAQTRSDGRDLAGELTAKGFAVTASRAEAEAVGSGKLAAMLAEEYMPPALYNDSIAAKWAASGMSAITGGRGDYLPWATGKALSLLSGADKKGFFLMVEGSQIDTWAHDNELEAVIAETHDFDEAVRVAMDFADRTPGTLVIVTADHETGGVTLPQATQDRATTTAVRFSTGGHTGTLVPVYAYGAGAARLSGIYENTAIPARIRELLELN